MTRGEWTKTAPLAVIVFLLATRLLRRERCFHSGLEAATRPLLNQVVCLTCSHRVSLSLPDVSGKGQLSGDEAPTFVHQRRQPLLRFLHHLRLCQHFISFVHYILPLLTTLYFDGNFTFSLHVSFKHSSVPLHCGTVFFLTQFVCNECNHK